VAVEAWVLQAVYQELSGRVSCAEIRAPQALQLVRGPVEHHLIQENGGQSWLGPGKLVDIQIGCRVPLGCVHNLKYFTNRS